MNQRKRIGILLFDDVEVLDFSGPYEVFSTTRLDEATRREASSPFEVLLVAENADPVCASGGMRVLPDVTIAACPPLDLLLVPGGWGTRREMENRLLLEWIISRAEQVQTLCAVCTGSLLLAELFPEVAVERKQHVVRDGAIYTSAGISAGIDLALLVTAAYFGEAIARATARHMEYHYPEDLARRI